METHSQDQQNQFMASFFPTDLTSMNQQQQGQQQQQQMSYNGVQAMGHNGNGQQQHHQQQQSGGIDMDLLGSLMAMQGVEHQGQNTMHQAMSPPLPAYNPTSQQQQNTANNSNPTPASLLEQQFKLNQLQQLQQLQNQIFQQQVRVWKVKSLFEIDC